ncbi:MAG TPA: PhnD/SsuA/transferrin family substrate-binding protein [Acidimicrobiia bacterium]|nr:PhnD/SsuA/transferrin family substrate-binding protein [Acidimicrobiia bacterium]
MTKRLLALLAVLAMVVAACGGDTADDTTTTTAAATTTTAAETTTTEAMEDPDAWPDRLVFGFVPSQEVAELQDEIDVFARVLSDALGIEVEGIVTTDYTGLGVALGTGQADLGAFGPAGYVLANQTYDNLELLAQSVRFGDPTYHGQWFTNDPSICDGDPVEGAYWYEDDGTVIAVGPTDTPALQVGWNGDDTRRDDRDQGLICPEPVDLEVVIGKTIAWGTETSTSGYIFPTLELIRKGITEDQYNSIFAGGHDASVQAVYDGSADIGVSFDDARSTIAGEYPDVGTKVIVFNITSRIANDVIAVRSDLPDDLKEALFQAMADFIATEEGQVVMEELYQWTDLTRADQVTADSLRAIEDAIRELGFGS